MDGSGDGQRSAAENESDSSATFNRASTNRNPFQLGLTPFGSASTTSFQLPSFRFGAIAPTPASQSTPSHQLSDRSIPIQQTTSTKTASNVFSTVTTPNVFRGFYKFDADKIPNLTGSQKSNVFAVSSTDSPVKFRQDEPLSTSDSSASVIEVPVSTSEKTVAEQNQSTKIPTASLFSHTSRNVRSSGSLFGRAMADVKSNFGTTGSHLPERPAVKKLAEDEAVPLKETVFLSPGEISRFTAIVCRGMPDSLNNKQFLLEHFSKFGTITKINCNTRKGLATVHFENGSSTVAAKQNGAILRDDLPPVTIFFSTSPKVSPKSSPKKSERPRKVEESSDDVNEELRAMEGPQSSDYVVFTEKPTVEEIPPLPIAKPRTTKAKSDSLQRQNKDNQSSDSPKYSRSDNTESLNSILNTPALTTEEKFNVLQVRDKLIRLKLKRHSDINTAIATAGICPDMCPEKERYLREDKRQLHYYETKQLTDKEKADSNYYFDPKLLVKEYSRSSADQEEPLSHELRPTEILDMTMNYLLCNIVQRLDDGSEDNATEWFDFLWNRTRAIRKDITQQHLCNQTCVALVEKCARFHIHCSVRLCEEDMINFDSKINNENLTKCLQTLKHFYTDLAALGEKCPNEPEFQAYNVLLNLNEGDILRHVQHLSPEVRQSPEIGFALQVFSALNSNNYVRFFKLVKKSDYLSACVLHRYFLQIRVKTLYTIMKAYCPPNHHAQFSLDKLVSILAFDNDVEALNFFNSYGLVVENNLVVLDRNKFCEPDSYVSKRPRLTLESKKMAPVAVILNGGVPLAPNPIWTYEPHVSFESNGLLKTSAIDAKDQLATLRLLSNCGIGPAQQQMQKEPSEVLPEAHSHASPVGSRREDDARLESVIVSVAEDLILDVTQELSHKLCTLTMAFYHAVLSYALPVASAFIGEELASNMREICEIVIEEAVCEREEARRKYEYEERKQMERIKEQVAEETQSSVMEWVVADGAVQIVHDAISEMWTNDFLKMALLENVARVCAEIHSEECMLRKRRKMIDAMIERRAIRRMKLTVVKWRSFVEKKRNRRRSMENFPTSFIEKSSSQIRRSSTGNITPVISPPKLAARRKCLSRCLDTSVLLCSLSQQLHSEPFDLRLIADPRVTKLWPSKTDSTWLAGSPCWKLCVDLTKVKSDTSKWMKQKFAMDKTCGGIVDISVGLISKGCEEDSTSKMLFGSQGIIYVHDTKMAFLRDAEHRLMSLVSMKPPVPAIPLLIVTFSKYKKGLFIKEEHDEVTVPQLLTEQGLLSDWMEIVVNIEDDLIDAPQLLHSGLCWLADKCPAPPRLVRKRLDHFMEDTLQQLFTENVHNRVDLRSILTWPSLFNTIIEHAAAVASDESLANYSWPPTHSSGWNSKHNLQDINKAILSLKLPPFTSEISEDSFWEENCKLLKDYVQTLDNPAPCLLMHRVESYMLNVEKQFSDDELIPQHLPWTFTFDSCIAYQIDKLKLQQQGTADPTMIVYDPEKLNHFDMIASATVHIPRKDCVSVKRKSGNSAILDVLPSKRLKESAYESFISQNDVLNEMCTRLNADVEAGKEEMSKCERFLEGLIGSSWPDEELSNQSHSPEINASNYQPDFQKMSLMEQLEYLKLQVSSCKRADANLESLLSTANYGT